MRIFRTPLPIIALVFLFNTSWAQTGQPGYVEQMADYTVNFYDAQEEFENYWGDRKVERSQGWKQFKRWEAFMEPRVYPTGDRPEPTVLWQETHTALMKGGSGLGNWSHVGPYDGNALSGIGRVNCLAFHPDNSNILFAGAPAGGLWRSNNGGVTWSTQTDLLPNLGVSAIVIDPDSPDTMYIATGDRDGGDTYSIGVLKSVDGGTTWQTTGLSYNVNSLIRVTGLYINPQNTDELVASTRNGIFRTTNGGTSWSNVQNGTFQMLTYSAAASDTLFAGTYSSGQVWRSVDAGATWTRMLTGLPASGPRRAEIATTAHDPNYVYAVLSASNNGLYGVYRSIDGGDSWTMVLDGDVKNLLHWDVSPSGNVTGGSSGGQGWYDLTIAVSPVNKNEVYVGGVNIWRSANGGTSWSLSAHWYGGGGAAYAHADQHNFTFKPGTSELYAGNDGGVYKTSNGTSYTPLCNGLHITQYYKIGMTEADPDVLIAGAQDNGTHLLDGMPFWDRVRGGDGMDCEIDQVNPNVMYSSIYYGDFRKSTNGGASFNATFNLPPSGTGNWVTPFALDPSNSNILYAGFSQLWKSTNAGVSFSALSSVGSGNITALAISKSDGQVIYIGKNEDVYRSGDGGSSWSLITGGISNSNSVTDIAISGTDPNQVFITKSGYNSGQKVFMSVNGGATWTNISGTLPNLPVNTIIYQDGSNGAVYIGTDVGVYYRDATSTDWEPFMDGLPNTIVNDLEIHYATGIIRAGTYGRGVWESPLLNSNSGRPVAGFDVSPGSICTIGDTVMLSDISTYNPTQWKWTLTPATYSFVSGTTDSSQNPVIVFTAPGKYTVQLIASNSAGSDTVLNIRVINIGGRSLPFVEPFDANIPSDWEVINPDQGITWSWDNTRNGSVYMDFYAYAVTPNEDELITPLLDFSGMDDVFLHYDMAYRPYSSSTHDSLHIYISTNCGATWTLIDARGENGTMNFATGPIASGNFVPTSGEWRSDTLDLSAYDGMSQVQLKFVGVNDYGNNLYLDNIGVDGQPSVAPAADFFVNQDVCAGSSVQFYETSTSGATSFEWIFPGGTPSTSTQNNPIVTYNTAGLHDVTLIVSNAMGSDTLIRSAHVNVQPALTPSVVLSPSNTTICEGESIVFTTSETNGGTSPTYEWYVNGNLKGVTGDSVSINLLNDGDSVRVKMTTTLGCVTLSEVWSTPVVINVLPNPVVSAGTYNPVCVDDNAFPLSGTPAGGTFTGQGVSGSAFDPQVTGSGTFQITYTYTDGNGCTNNDVVGVQVTPKPNVFLAGMTLCESDPSQAATGGFPTGGTYQLNGINVTNIDPTQMSPGNYTYTYTYTNSICEVIKTDSIRILVAPVNPTITVGTGVLTCDLSGYQYQWLNASGNPIPGETNQEFYPQVSGYYSVIVKAGSTCSETSVQVYIETVGLSEQLAREIGLQIYPNPAKDFSMIRFELRDIRHVQIELLDLAGRVLMKNDLGQISGRHEERLNLKSIASGACVIRLTIGDVTTSARIVKE